MCWGGVEKCVGVWRSVERCEESRQHFPIPHHLHLPPPHPKTLSHISPNASPHTPSPLTSPTPQHTSLHLSAQLLLPPPHPNTLFYTSPNTSSFTYPTLPNTLHSPYSPHDFFEVWNSVSAFTFVLNQKNM